MFSTITNLAEAWGSEISYITIRCSWGNSIVDFHRYDEHRFHSPFCYSLDTSFTLPEGAQSSSVTYIDSLWFNKIFCRTDFFASSITPDCPLFSPGLESFQNYRWWQINTFMSVPSLLMAQGRKSFQQLRESHYILDSERFHYLQIRHLLQSLTRNHDWFAPLTAFESRCHSNLTTYGLVSLIYSSILGNSTAQPRPISRGGKKTLQLPSPLRNGKIYGRCSTILCITYWCMRTHTR